MVKINQKKFSVILPVRNGGEYLKECVNSVLAQTLDDFNFIILDNNSKDGSIDWLKSLSNERIIIYSSNTDLPIESNWKRIVDIPKNEFITLIGHDDLLKPDFLETINGLIHKHPSASLFTSHFSYINSQGNLIRNCKPMDEIQLPHEFLSQYLCNMIDCMGTGFVMRSKDYDEIGGIPTRYPNLLFADFELWIRLTSKNYKVTSFNNCFSFRLHNSTTTNSGDDKFQKAFFLFLDFLIEIKSKSSLFCNSIERYSNIYLDFYIKGLSHRLLRTPRNSSNKFSVNDFIEKSIEFADKLVPNIKYQPKRVFSVNLAYIIDKYSVTRWIFIRFKKMFKKPFL